MTSPVGEVRVCECMPDFPSCAGCYQIGKRLIFLSPQPEYWVMTCTVNNWKREARAQKGTYQGDMDLIKQFRDSIRRHTHEPVGTPCLWIPLAGPWASFCRWLVSIHRNLAWFCGSGKDYKIEHLSLPLGKQKGGCKHMSWLYRIERSHTSLRILPQEGARSVEHAYP